MTLKRKSVHMGKWICFSVGNGASGRMHGFLERIFPSMRKFTRCKGEASLTFKVKNYKGWGMFSIAENGFTQIFYFWNRP